MKLKLKWSASTREWVLLLATALTVMTILAGVSEQGEVQWNYLASILLIITIYAIFSMGLSLEFGSTGLVNFGHVGFMLIGAYTYGILMMPQIGRPANAAGPVGALYDFAPNLEGATAVGFLVCLLAALVAGTLVAIPLLFLLQRSAGAMKRLDARALVLRFLGALAALGLGQLILFLLGPVERILGQIVGGALYYGALFLVRVSAFLLTVAAIGFAVFLLFTLAQRLAPALSRPRAHLVAAAVIGLATTGLVLWALFPLSPHGALNAAVFLAILAGMVVASLAGLLLGLPTVRLREDYLAIVTIGAAEILRSMVLNEEEWTRGSRTIVNFHRPLIDWALGTSWWSDFADTLDVRPASFAVLAVSLVILAYVFLLLDTLERSPWGRVLKSIREDEEAASSLGKNVLRYKLQSLMVGSAIAALAGVLLITSQGVITPVAFLPLVTFYAFIIVIVGGAGSLRGAIAGSFLLWGIFSLAQNLSALERLGIGAGPPQVIFVGLLLVLVMMFRPEGLLGRKEEMAHAK